MSDDRTPPPEPGFHMDPEEFRRLGKEMIDWIADYHGRVEDLPVRSQVEPGWVADQLPGVAPETGEPFEAMMADVERVVVPGLTHWQSPNYFAYFPSNVSYPSILGELLSAGLGVQGMLWSTSPACTEVETRVLDWLGQALGLPEAFLSTGSGGGVIQDTASSAGLCALIAARDRVTGFAAHREGVRQPLTAYTSSQAHSSIEKAVQVAGLGAENLRSLPVDEGYRLRPQALAEALREDRAAGRIPCFVAATVGTTSSLAVDPIPEIARVVAEDAEGAVGAEGTPGAGEAVLPPWVHVDGAMAGTAALCPEHRWLHEGLAAVDSYCVNPHKWMFTNFDCSAFWVRDREALIRSLSVLPEYLKNAATLSGAVIDYRDWQIPLGRRFRALKLWFVLRWYGLEGLRAHLRHHLELAEDFARRVEAEPCLEMVVPRSLNLVCFAHRRGDEATEELLESLNASGHLFLTHTRLAGRFVARFVVGHWATERRHLDAAWQRIEAAARTLDRESR